MANVSPGWALEIFGDQIDLDDLCQFLTPSLGVWIEEYQPPDSKTQVLLRSTNWQTLTSAEEVEVDGKRVIDRVNGEMLLLLKDTLPARHQLSHLAPNISPPGVDSPCPIPVRPHLLDSNSRWTEGSKE